VRLVGAEPPQSESGDAVVVDLDAEEDGLELLERLEEEVEGQRTDAPAIHLYDPPAALPGQAPASGVQPHSYESATRPPEAR
jgi:hypothetical protein